MASLYLTSWTLQDGPEERKSSKDANLSIESRHPGF